MIEVAARILLLKPQYYFTVCIQLIGKDFYLSRDFDLSGGFVFFLVIDTCQVHHIINLFSSEAINFHLNYLNNIIVVFNPHTHTHLSTFEPIKACLDIKRTFY